MAETTFPGGTRNFHGRQYELRAMVDFGGDPNDIINGVTVKLPPGSLLTSGSVNVQTVFGGTAPKLTALDNASTPVSLFGSVAADAVADTAALVAGSGAFYPFGAIITIKVLGGTVTNGLAIVTLGYIQLNRENEVYTA